MALTKKDENRVVSRVFFWLSSIAAVVLLVAGVLLCNMGTKVVKQVNEGIISQKIYFPPKGAAFSEQAYPDIQEYAGTQVKDGAAARVYAEDFLGKQAEVLGGGKVLSEISAMVAMDPTNASLQQLHGAMFQLEVARGTLLSDGYGAWAQATMIKNLGTWSIVAAGVLAVIAVVQCVRYKRL